MLMVVDDFPGVQALQDRKRRGRIGYEKIGADQSKVGKWGVIKDM